MTRSTSSKPQPTTQALPTPKQALSLAATDRAALREAIWAIPQGAPITVQSPDMAEPMLGCTMVQARYSRRESLIKMPDTGEVVRVFWNAIRPAPEPAGEADA